jgi:Chlorophyll A-B binding protein
VEAKNSDENTKIGKDRNAFVFGFTPQAELWNGRLAMMGLTAYFIWIFNVVGLLVNLFSSTFYRH